MAKTVIWDGTDADNDYQAAGNFAGAALPVTGDSAIIAAMDHADGTDIDGVDDSAVLLVGFTIEEGCSVDIGVHSVTGTYLNIDADNCYLDGDGTVLLQVDNCTAINVTGAGAAGADGTHGMYLKGDATTLTIDLEENESVGLAPLSSETGTFTTTKITGSGDVTIGSGVTCTTLVIGGDGTVKCHDTIATVTSDGATFTYTGAGMSTSLTVISGTTNYNGTGTIVALNVHSDGTVDFHNDLRAKTITTLTMYRGSTLDIRGSHVTITNAIATPDCSPTDVTIKCDPGQALNFA